MIGEYEEQSRGQGNWVNKRGGQRKREGQGDGAGPQHLGFCGLQNILSLGLGS